MSIKSFHSIGFIGMGNQQNAKIKNLPIFDPALCFDLSQKMTREIPSQDCYLAGICQMRAEKKDIFKNATEK